MQSKMTSLNATIVPVTPFRQNCTVIWDKDSKRGAVIDPGGDVERILQAVEQSGAAIERIYLTHGHIDHAGGAQALQEALATRNGGAAPPVEGPDERDRFLLEGLEAQAVGFGIPGIRNVVPDRWLQEGDRIDIAGQPFDVLHCPGHTPGHLVFVNRNARFAIVGDVLFRGSVGRTDFPYGDHEALIDAIRTKLLPLGDEVVFICGHGEASSIGTERQTNPFIAGGD